MTISEFMREYPPEPDEDEDDTPEDTHFIQIQTRRRVIEEVPAFDSLSDDDDGESLEAPNDAPPSGQQFLENLITPNTLHVNDVSNFARLIHYNAGQLVIALDDSGDATAHADIYAVDPQSGMLSSGLGAAALAETGSRYMQAIIQKAWSKAQRSGRKVTKNDVTSMHEETADATRLSNATALERMRKIAPAAVAYLRLHDAIPPQLTVCQKSDLDRDMKTVGTPNGVLDLLTGRILPPAEARKRLVTASTGVEFSPQSQHPLLNEILPPLSECPEGSVKRYRAEVLGWTICNPPRREFLWEVSEPGSGKSTFVNAIRRGLGDTYVTTPRAETLKRPYKDGDAGSHNGDVRHLTAPARLAFFLEFSGKAYAPTLKRASGGDRLSFRRINREDESAEARAHIWIFGNTSENAADDPQLGINGADSTSDAEALRDRAKVLRRERIESEKRNPEVVDIATPEFKRAALSRLLEYTSAFGATGFPADLPVMREWQQEQAERELEPWQREWLPFALRPTAPSEPPCDNTEVYRDYELWHDSEGDGPKISKEKIGRAVCAHYGITPGKQQRGAHGVRVRPYQGYALLITEEWGDGAQVRYLSRGG